MRQYTTLLVLLTLAACGDQRSPPAADQTGGIGEPVLEKAREIEGMIGDISAAQHWQIDQQTR